MPVSDRVTACVGVCESVPEGPCEVVCVWDAVTDADCDGLLERVGVALPLPVAV